MKFKQKADVAARNSRCTIRLDRLVVTGIGHTPQGAEKIEGFRRVSDFRPRPQGKFTTYARLRKFRSLRNSATISQQYQPTMHWLPKWRFTLIGDDKTGILPYEVEAVLANCLNHRVTLFELALDFPFASKVDETTVLRHALFGKSRRRKKQYEGPTYFGSRTSTKLVRCYEKTAVASYRIELEIHSGLLHKSGVKRVRELSRFAKTLCPSHVRFVFVSWLALKRYLKRRFGTKGEEIYVEAQSRSQLSLRRAMRYLARQGVTNVHRFLIPSAVDDEIKRGLNRWARRWGKNVLINALRIKEK
jgi:hypothetical protein